MELKPGDRLIESKLKSEFDVSQTTIREAIRVLDKYGLVNILPRRGTVVSGFSISDVEWMYDILTELYGLIVKKIIRVSNIPIDLVEKMRNMFQRLEESATSNDVDAYYSAIFDFAVLSLKVLDSRLLEKMTMDLWPAKRRIEYLTLSRRKDSLKDNFDLFSPIKKYIEMPDADMAAKIIKNYTQNEKRIAMEIIKDYLSV